MTEFLDLDRVRLYGGERVKSDLVIYALVRAINGGNRLPPVNVLKLDDITYVLHNDEVEEELENRGGHHLAIAHLRAREPLEVAVIGTKTCLPDHYIEIWKIFVVPDASLPLQKRYAVRKK